MIYSSFFILLLLLLNAMFGVVSFLRMGIPLRYTLFVAILFSDTPIVLGS